MEPFLDIPLSFEVELEKTTLTVRALLALRIGSVIALSRPLGADVRIVVSGAEVGAGELVSLDDSVAARITRLGRDAR